MAYLSRSDAHHDLADLFTETIYKKDHLIKAAFDSGLPIEPEKSFNEESALASVIISISNPNGTNYENIIINNQVTDLQKALSAVPDCNKLTKSDRKESLFRIGLENETFFNYGVV